jgi:4-amino-4-deoxy-L-arabinose transferase-like glycosyltransferase
MNSTQGALAAKPPHAGRLRAASLSLGRVRPEPVALALLAGTLNFWNLSTNGWANAYYSATVRSMSANWHNFLYASFDPSGVMTVDKPPLALWIQALSVKVFGFHPLAVLAPQALMGVASVLLVYDLTRRQFGRAPGLLAGLVLALTPIAVAVSRHNNPDALLVLCSVAALWCALRALERQRTRWFVLAGICIGLGFETKMLIAFAVVPGIAAAWAWMRTKPDAGVDPTTPAAGVGESLRTPRRARARARVRARRGPLIAAAAMLLVAGAWPALIELTPSASRPWIAGTADNRVLSLIFGYNGLGRIEGQTGGPQALGGSNLFGGNPGPLRLLNSALGGQAGWLLGFALLSGLALLAACRLRRSDPRTGWLLIVGGAFLTTAAVFSFADGIFHPYYVSLLAPFSAALVGAGFAQLTARRAVALFAAGIATELIVLHDYPGELRWLTPTLIVGGALALSLMLVGSTRLRRAVLAGSLSLLLLAPATWAVETLGHPASGTFPAGGPADNPASEFGGPRGGGAFRVPSGAGLAGQSLPGFAAPGRFAGPPPGGAQGAPAGGPPMVGGPEGGAGTRGAFGFGGPAARARTGAHGGPFGGTTQSLTQAVRYADSHGGGTVAVSSQSEAATSVIDGARVAGIGGFSGRESETTAAWLAREVRAGRIRWVLTATGFGGGPVGDKRVGAGRALSAAAAACQPVSAVSGLYDCAGSAAKLAAAARD